MKRETETAKKRLLGAFAGRFNSVHLIGNPHSLSSTDELVRFKKEDVHASVLALVALALKVGWDGLASETSWSPWTGTRLRV
jgi:hypothetical protein